MFPQIRRFAIRHCVCAHVSRMMTVYLVVTPEPCHHDANHGIVFDSSASDLIGECLVVVFNTCSSAFILFADRKQFNLESTCEHEQVPRPHVSTRICQYQCFHSVERRRRWQPSLVVEPNETLVHE